MRISHHFTVLKTFNYLFHTARRTAPYGAARCGAEPYGAKTLQSHRCKSTTSFTLNAELRRTAPSEAAKSLRELEPKSRCRNAYRNAIHNYQLRQILGDRLRGVDFVKFAIAH